MQRIIEGFKIIIDVMNENYSHTLNYDCPIYIIIYICIKWLFLSCDNTFKLKMAYKIRCVFLPVKLPRAIATVQFGRIFVEDAQ